MHLLPSSRRASPALPLWPARGPMMQTWRYVWSGLSVAQLWTHRPTLRHRKLLLLRWRQEVAHRRLEVWRRLTLQDQGLLLFGVALLVGAAAGLSYLPPLARGWMAGGAGAMLLGLLARLGWAGWRHRIESKPGVVTWKAFWDAQEKTTHPWQMGLGLAALWAMVSSGLAWSLPASGIRPAGGVAVGVFLFFLGCSEVWRHLAKRSTVFSDRLWRYEGSHRERVRLRWEQVCLAWPCELPDPGLRAHWRQEGLADLDAYIDRAAASALGWTRWDQMALCHALGERAEYLPALTMSAAEGQVPSLAPEAWARWRLEATTWPALVPLKRVLAALSMQVSSQASLPESLAADIPTLWALHQQAHALDGLPLLPEDPLRPYHPYLSAQRPAEMAMRWIQDSLDAPIAWIKAFLEPVPDPPDPPFFKDNLLYEVANRARKKQWERLACLETCASGWLTPADYLNVETYHGTQAQWATRLPQVSEADRRPFLLGWANPEQLGLDPVLPESTLAQLVAGVNWEAWWAHQQEQMGYLREDEWGRTHAAIDRLAAYAPEEQQLRWLATLAPGALPRTQAQVRAAALSRRPAAPSIGGRRRA